MTETIYVVASQEEKERFVPIELWKRCVVTGVGYANVFRALNNIPRNTKVINFGYAGSNRLRIGSMCSISESRNYHPNCEFQNDPVYNTEEIEGFSESFPCYTSGDFVTESNVKETVVFDMELYAIFAMGFRHVSAAKFITDNLSADEYDQNTGGNKE